MTANQRVRIWRCIWDLLAEPRSVTTITLACYLTAIAVGIHTLNTPLVGLGVV